MEENKFIDPIDNSERVDLQKRIDELEYKYRAAKLQIDLTKSVSATV